jgi:hypothetical protein
MWERQIYNSKTNEVVAIVKMDVNDESKWQMAASAYEFGTLKEEAKEVE